MNPYALFGEFIGLVAVVLIFGGGHLRRFLDIMERRVDQRRGRSDLSEPALGQVESLRAEVARLRDTSTQYDVSIQHTLEDLQQRVSSLESRKRSDSAIVKEEEQQPITLNSSQP